MVNIDHVVGQLKEILEIVYKNKKTSDRLEANWDKDRKDFSEFSARMLHMEAEVKELRAIVMNLPSQTKDRVSDVISPIVKSADNLAQTTDNLTETIEKKKVSSNGKGWHLF